jgi:hypothetical protein
MLSAQQARELALGLPEAVEQDHHGRPSFRVGGLATLWSEQQLNVMLDEDGIRTVTQAHGDICEEVWWGKRLAAVLPRAEAELVSELLTDAWERKAPERLAGGGGGDDEAV